MRHGRTGRWAVAAVALAVAAAADGLGAQAPERWSIEAGVTGVLSSRPTLDRGIGFGARVLMAADDPTWLRIGIAAMQMSTRSEREGMVCHRLDPTPLLCRPERLEEEVLIRSYGVGAFPEVDLSWTVRLRGGLGIAIHEVSGTSRGMTTDGRGNLYLVPWGHLGSFGELALLWSPFARAPLDAIVSGGGSLIWFDACRDDPDLFSPLCGATGLGELRLGLSYRLGG